MFTDRVNDKSIGVRGEISLWQQRHGLWQPVSRHSNQIQYDWGFIAAQTIGKGLRSYRIATMYIEFENVVDPGDAVSVPSFTREEGIEYYDDLLSSPTRDYVRVPLLQEPLLGIASGFEDFFTDGLTGNRLTFTAMTAGTTGVNGKTFSDTVNSKICGAALVASPVFSDRTQDVIFSRGYLDLSQQVVKEASGQIICVWDVSFE